MRPPRPHYLACDARALAKSMLSCKTVKYRSANGWGPPRSAALPQSDTIASTATGLAYSCGKRSLSRLAEANEIGERVNHAGLQCPPGCGFKSRSHIPVALRGDLGMKGLNTLHHHPDASTGAAVAVMFAEMQDQIAARNLAIKWSARIEAVVPIDREAKKPPIEFVCLGDVEDA